MTKTTVPPNAIRVLPEQHLRFETDNGDVILYIELPKHPSDPYLTVRHDFVPKVPNLKEDQRN